MKIAIVSQPWETLCPPRTGSVEIQIWEAARRLAKSCEVLVYARHRRGRHKLEWEEGVQFRRFRILHGHRLISPFENLIFRHPNRPFFSSPLFYASYAYQVARHVASQNCDVIHVHNFHRVAALVKKFSPRSNVVLHMHCDWLGQLDQDTILPSLKKMSGIIGCSNYIADRVARRFPEFADRCRGIYCGVDPAVFHPDKKRARKAESPLKILYVGRVSPEKGVHILLDAFRHVTRSVPGVELDIVGPDLTPPPPMVASMSDDPVALASQSIPVKGYRRRILENLPEDVRQRIRFHNTIANSDLPRFYQESAVCVFPSLFEEPFGIPVAEAMACGVPVVGAKSGGIAESIDHGKTGLLVERGDAEGLAAALTTMLLNPVLRDTMGQNGRARALQLFSWSRTVDELLSFYESLNQHPIALAGTSAQTA